MFLWMLRHRLRALVLLLSALVVLVLAGGVGWQSVESNQARKSFPGRLVAVGNLRLQPYCTGHGGPSVILDSGLGETLVDWQLVQPVVARRTTVCSYDRAGLGASSADSAPRDAKRMADQLASLITQAAVPKPYVLVGHSLGGLTMRVFAGRHPAEVAGLALIDSASPTDASALPPEVEAQQRSQFTPTALCSGVSTTDRLRRAVGIDRLAFVDARVDSSLPLAWQEVQRQDARRWIDGLSAPCAEGYAEHAAIPASDREAARVTTLGSLPLAVVTRGLAETWPPPVPIARTETAWRAEQQKLTQLSTTTRWTTARGARHYVMLDQPGAVIDAITWLLDQSAR